MRATKTEICNFVVPGRAIPAIRMNHRMKRSKRNLKYMHYRNQIGWIAKSAYTGKPVESDVRVKIDIYLNGGRQGDVDNYFKTITDSLNKIVYEDDRQIKEMFARKIECDSAKYERVEVTVYEL